MVFRLGVNNWGRILYPVTEATLSVKFRKIMDFIKFTSA
ncbi:Uncharacterised protein [Streptococcus pneumoniae]|nr:Uncharacterised protein [Streptococcus pneumoniae]VPD54181.1 Uncharacterised protein [Streptococcus pneumoniae]